MQLPYRRAWRCSLGGNVRVGLEDNLYLVTRRAGDQRRSSSSAPCRSSRRWAPASSAPPRCATRLGLRSTAVSPRPAPRRVGAARRRRDRRRLGGALRRSNGLDVAPDDPDPDAERKLGEVLGERLAARSSADASRRCRAAGALHSSPTLEDAVADADFVQESAPEREELKRALLAASMRAAPAGRVIASSHVGPAADAAAGRHARTRALRRRPSVQPGLPAAAGRGRAAASDRRRDASTRAAASTRRSACSRSWCGTRSTASSPTACSRRSGARRC